MFVVIEDSLLLVACSIRVPAYCILAHLRRRLLRSHRLVISMSFGFSLIRSEIVYPMTALVDLWVLKCIAYDSATRHFSGIQFQLYLEPYALMHVILAKTFICGTSLSVGS